MTKIKRWWNKLQHETQAGIVTIGFFLFIASFFALPWIMLPLLVVALACALVYAIYRIILDILNEG